MTLTESLQIEEYRTLRQEHENNRRFVFERPLVVVIGMIAASTQGDSLLEDIPGLLPLVFLTVLWFNLWFTYNRLQSCSRIVAYIQLVHEQGSGTQPVWIGWENALLKYRDWLKNGPKEEKRQIRRAAVQKDSMGFYPQIFTFHLVCGVLFVSLNLIQYGSLDCIVAAAFSKTDPPWPAMDAIAILAFIAFALPYWPTRIRTAIGRKRLIWGKVLSPQSSY